MDPYSRAPQSRSQVDGLVQSSTPDDVKSSPVVDQVSSCLHNQLALLTEAFAIFMLCY